MPRTSVSPARERSRRPRVPPALTRGNEQFEGLAILDELDDDLGLMLWRSLRNVLTWARAEQDRRAGVFAHAAASLCAEDVARLSPDAELLAPLAVMVALLERPGEMDEPRVVNACRRIALWAEDRGLLATALDFAQAAALVNPHSAMLAYAVGRLARRRAEYDRAESWLLRAIIQGRLQKEWRTYAIAFLGMGNLWVQKGNYPEARRFHQRCLRAAVRHGLRDLEASAAHDLFGIAVETNDPRDAEGFARQAFDAYEPSHPLVPRLAHDVAYFWTLQGHFDRAFRVASAVLPHFRAESDRLLVLADMARAAGGSGLREEFERSAEEVWRLAASPSALDSAARALLDVAHGAASLGRWAEAEQAASHALAIAVERREGKVVVTAESVLDFVHSRMVTQDRSTAPHDREAETLADRMVDALAEAAAAGVG